MFIIKIIRSVSNPTLKGEIKKARASGYTFVKAMGDICDGSITMDGGKNIEIILWGTDNVISSIEVKDDIINGMEKLQKYRYITSIMLDTRV